MRVTILLLAIFLISCGPIQRRNKQIVSGTSDTMTLKSLIPNDKNEKVYDCIIVIDSNYNHYLNERLIIDSNLLDSLKIMKSGHTDYKVKLLVDSCVTLDKVVNVTDICNILKIELALETK
ncbi:MAG: hypothetical protein PF590_04500 [Candidatus Delongbacteria bacterium]|jgi:biopolymer transport protein ExbD|nr:hypothetical protein [Candidatus Delongbacteria bacterium]